MLVFSLFKSKFFSFEVKNCQNFAYFDQNRSKTLGYVQNFGFLRSEI